MKDEETIVKHFLRSDQDDLRLSDESKQRILENIRMAGQELPSKRRSARFRNYASGTAAACAAVIIFGGLCTVLIHHEQGQHMQTAAAKPSQQKFDYRRILGFQPMLPAHMPKGFKLTYIGVDTETGSTEGDVYGFSAIYRKGKAEYTISESRTTMSQTLPRGMQMESVKINGIEGKAYEADGYHVQFEKDGILYHVSMDGMPLDYDTGQQTLDIAADLNVPATQKPDQNSKTIK
jgi:hypothetical protein